MIIIDEIRNKFFSSRKKINEIIWIILIPIGIDLFNLFLYEYFFKEKYVHKHSIIIFTMRGMTSPPNVNMVLLDFPNVIFNESLNLSTGIFDKINLFNLYICIIILLIQSFMNSAYLTILYKGKINIKSLFVLVNKNWYKFLVLNLMLNIPLILMCKIVGYIYITIFNFILSYCKYIFIISKDSVFLNIKKSTIILKQNFLFTIKMILYFGVVLALVSFVLNLVVYMRYVGIILCIIIVAYVGTIINKTILEVCKEKFINEI